VVVHKLVDLKLVQRARSASDARRAELFLTPKGRRILQSAPPSAQTGLISAIAVLPKNRRNILGQCLLELIQNTGLDRHSPALFFEDHPPRRRSRKTR
jgi:DNA-binding MarR family transcriptional regulator